MVLNVVVASPLIYFYVNLFTFKHSHPTFGVRTKWFNAQTHIYFASPVWFFLFITRNVYCTCVPHVNLPPNLMTNNRGNGPSSVPQAFHRQS